MSLAEEARALQGIRGPKCSVGVLQREDPTLSRELDDAIHAGVQASALSRALRNRGVTISAETIRRHHSGDCACRR